MALQAKKTEIQIPKPNIKETRIQIDGETSLIYHAWAQKAILMMLNKQLKTAASNKREAKNPAAEVMDTFYVDSKGNIAFPTLCLKQAMVNAARNIEGLTMTILRGAIFVEDEKVTGMTPIYVDKKLLTLKEVTESIQKQDDKKVFDTDDKGEYWRRDMVRVGMGSADIRFRGEILNWSMRPKIRWNDDVLSIEQVINLLNTAGFACGLGEWRPEKNGDHGTFSVSSELVENK